MRNIIRAYNVYFFLDVAFSEYFCTIAVFSSHGVRVIHCDVIPFILDVTFVDVPAGVTQEEGHTGFFPTSFCGACLHFSREKDSAVPFPRRP